MGWAFAFLVGCVCVLSLGQGVSIFLKLGTLRWLVVGSVSSSERIIGIARSSKNTVSSWNLVFPKEVAFRSRRATVLWAHFCFYFFMAPPKCTSKPKSQTRNSTASRMWKLLGTRRPPGDAQQTQNNHHHCRSSDLIIRLTLRFFPMEVLLTSNRPLW